MDAAVALSPTLLQANAPQPSAADLARRADVKRTAEAFEASFLSVMLQPMFQGTDPAAPFGGGPGEQMFKSFMTEAFAKQMTKAGGIGLTDVIGREMLKLQGLE